jgi:tetratricopeptide (TPR) repeat protein
MTKASSQKKQPAQSGSRQEDRTRRLLNRGASLLERGKAPEAIHYLEKAHALDARNVATLINLGGAYVLAGRHKHAIPLLEAARDLEPDNASIWTNLAAAYLGNPILATPEQQLQAIRAFQEALRLNPAAPNVHYNLGLIFVDRQESDLAMEAFRHAIQVNPHDRDARLWLRKLESQDSEGAENE